MTGDVDYSNTKVWDLLSKPRMAPYLHAAQGDRAAAMMNQRSTGWSAGRR
ncbi:hypothetical protein ABTW96_16520 [Nocardia beijingensis]